MWRIGTYSALMPLPSWKAMIVLLIEGDDIHGDGVGTVDFVIDAVVPEASLEVMSIPPSEVQRESVELMVPCFTVAGDDGAEIEVFREEGLPAEIVEAQPGAETRRWF